MKEKQTHCHQVGLTTDLGTPQFPQALCQQQETSSLSKEAQAAFLLCPSRGRNNCHPGTCPSQHLSAPASTSQAAADNMHHHLWPGLTADTVEHPPMCPLPPLQRNPPQARFHPQATRRAQIFAEYLDT